MAKQNSFEKATKGLKAAKFGKAAKEVVNLAAEFEKHGIVVDRQGLEK